MAFISLIFASAFIMILLSFIGVAFLFLIIGLVIRKKHTAASKVLFTLSGINIFIPILVITLIVIPKPKTVETRDGTAVLMPGWIKKYNEYIEENNIRKLNDLLDKHPDMIYYYDINRTFLIDYGMNNMNVEIMQAAVNHGAVFDDPLRYDHLIYDSSFEAFFAEIDEDFYAAGNADDKMMETVEFMILHGAALQYNSYPRFEFDNFYDHAAYWVGTDGVVTDKEQQLLELIAGHMKNSDSD